VEQRPSPSGQISRGADGLMEDIPRWSVSNFEFDEEEASFAIRCNGKLFYIDVLATDLGDWPGKQQFLQLLQDASEDYEAEESLYDLISGPCIPLLRNDAPKAPDGNKIVLHEYYAPKTLLFKLIGDGNDIKAVRAPDDHRKNRHTLTPNRSERNPR
jgi:hypothetical protein